MIDTSSFPGYIAAGTVSINDEACSLAYEQLSAQRATSSADAEMPYQPIHPAKVSAFGKKQEFPQRTETGLQGIRFNPNQAEVDALKAKVSEMENQVKQLLDLNQKATSSNLEQPKKVK